MTPWNLVKSYALTLIRHDLPEVDMAAFDRWLIPAGYPGARSPHSSTRDLVFVYAASLRNAGGPGPTWARFALLVTDAIASEWISDERLQNFAVDQLARSCYELLQAGHDGLAASGIVDYQDQLRSMAAGENISPRILQGLLQSVTNFCNLLSGQYQGSAVNYHDSILDSDTLVPNMIGDKLAEILEFPKIGPAVGMNFLKDSQGSALVGIAKDAWFDSPLAWFVKADMHVARLMLYETMRAQQAGIQANLLTHRPIADVLKQYLRYQPQNGHGPEVAILEALGELPEWHVVAEIHHWARQQGVSGLEIDRILYLIGSGRFGLKRLTTPQEIRYQGFCQLVDVNTMGDGNMAVQSGG